MTRGLPQLIIMISGAVLIAAGLFFVALQFQNETRAARILSQPVDPMSQHMAVDPGKGVDLSTRFVGLEIVVVGAVLEIVGFLGLKPWTGKS
jgi:uncharacterized membrane protein